MTFLLAAANPAGGAALREVIGASLGAGVASTLLFGLGLGHRAGRTDLLERWSAFAARVGGLPGVGRAALRRRHASRCITALFGMYWDISLHIDQGRDPGPLANPAHYLILVGLFGDLRRRLPRDRAAARSKPRPDGDPDRPGLVRAARRRPDAAPAARSR